MAFGFRIRIPVGRGSINIGKRSVSASRRVAGVRVTASSEGRVTVSKRLGGGLFWRETFGRKRR